MLPHLDSLTRRPARLAGACAVAALASLAGCSGAPDDSERLATSPPAPLVGEVSANPSLGVPTALPELIVAYDISTASSITVVVTKRRPLSPLTYEPGDLVTVSGVPGDGTDQLRAEAAAAITRMYEGAVAAGVPFSIDTAYRDYALQERLYTREVKSSGVAAADRLVARPGYSEHQTGLTADVYDVPANLRTPGFGETGAGVWIREHAHEYGFIVSYPNGSEPVTGYVYEPWHVRYVGTAVATDMHDSGVVTLQEYFGVEAAPDYG